MDMNFLELCEARYSVRKYSTEAVSDDDLKYVLECARMAQSAVNFQPWQFVIVRSDEAKANIRRCYNREWFATAPLYIVDLRNTDENWVRSSDGKAHGDIDVAIAVEHICLAAAERGLGTCWVANYDTELLNELFADEGFEAVAIVPIGHIAADCPKAPKKRKDMSQIVKEV